MIIKIKKSTLVVTITIFLVIAGIITTIILNPGEGSASQKQEQVNSPDLNKITIIDSKETQKTTMGKVEVDVTPQRLGKFESQNIFTVNLNTHSVELDFDFTKIITLEDNLGSKYQALEWTGNRGWHHVSGDIIFPSIDEQASEVSLKIEEIEGQTRTFSWNVEN